MNVVLHLALAGSNPDDPTNLAVPILSGQRRNQPKELKLTFYQTSY